MAVKIGHAVMAEDGTAGKTGAQIGDQTGKEIAFRSWYKSGSGWQYLLVPKDDMLGDRAATYMEQIVPDPAFGYSQHAEQRWSGYKAILANGGKVNGAKGDFDCATLCLACYILAGLDHAPSGYTGSMYKTLMATGAFDAYTDAAYLSSGDYAKRGALYLRKGHVAMALNDGPLLGQAAPVTPHAPVSNVYTGEADDVDPPYVLVLGNKVNIRNGSGTEFDDIGDARKGDKYPYQGTDSSGKKWYMIEFEDMTAFISPLPNLTKLVLEDEAVVNEEAEVDPPYVEIKGKVNVRNAGGWTLDEKGKKVYNGKVIYTAKDEKLPFEEFDADSGWYGVMSPAGAGFVSCDLPRSAILVEN